MSVTPKSLFINRSETSVKDFGAIGDGVQSDVVALQTAGTFPDIIYPQGTYLIDSNCTIGSPGFIHRFSKGSIIFVNTGVTLTINGRIVADNTQMIFSGSGTVLFTEAMDYIPVSWFGARGDGITDSFSAIMKAHNATLSSGGTLFFADGYHMTSGELAFTKPIKILLSRGGISSDGTTSTLISTTSSLTIEGFHSYYSALTPKFDGYAILIKPRPFPDAGQYEFKMRDIHFKGGLRGVNAQGLTGFYGGEFLVEDCFFSTQTDVSIWMDSSVFYSFISRTYFYDVYGAIYVKDNCELKVHHVTVEVNRNGTKPCIEGRGVAHLDVDCCTLMIRRPNPSPDILLYPSANNLDGMSWIRNTKLSPEGYTDLRTGPHILVYDATAPTLNSLYQLDICNNKFYAPSQLNLVSIGRSSNVVTATVTNPWPEGHGLQVGDRVAIGFILADSSFNGTFTVTAIGSVLGSGPFTQTVSWAQTGGDVGQADLGGIIMNAGLSAIEFRSPVTHANVSGNEMLNYSYGLDDSAVITSTILDVAGAGIWKDNKINGPMGYAWKEFKRGGHGFSHIENRIGSQQEYILGPPRNNETQSLMNRIDYSEDFSQWGSLGLTKTDGYADPWGTTRATLLQRSGTIEIWTGNYPGQSITEGMARGIDDTTGSPVSGFISFWGKSGTLDVMSVSVINGSTGNIEFHHSISLAPNWHRYVLPFCRNSDAGVRSLVICPGANARIQGDGYIVGVQVSDIDSDYYFTDGSIASVSNVGNRYEQSQIHAVLTASQAVVTDADKKLISHPYTTSAAANSFLKLDSSSRASIKGIISSGTAPTVDNVSSSIGIGGTLTLSTGSNDLAGSIIINTGTDPDGYVIFDLNYSSTLPGNTPVVNFQLANSDGYWGGIVPLNLSNVTIFSSDNTKVRGWANNLNGQDGYVTPVSFEASLPNGYIINYQVILK
jgi:hypothetical protein